MRRLIYHTVHVSNADDVEFFNFVKLINIQHDYLESISRIW